MSIELEKQVKVLEDRLRLTEQDGSVRAYYALQRILNQQVNYLNGFVLKSEIGLDPKSDKTYERAEKIWGSLQKLASELNILRSELKLSGNENEDLDKRVSFIATIAQDRK